MKTDYMTEGCNLPPYLLYPLFLSNMDLRPTAKMIYCILLDMIINSDESVQRDSLDRYYLTVSNKIIAGKINRTPTTVAQALIELENVDLAERKWVGRNAPCHIYVKLP